MCAWIEHITAIRIYTKNGTTKTLTGDQVDSPRRIITIAHGDPSTIDALGAPLSDHALSLFQPEISERREHISQ